MGLSWGGDWTSPVDIPHFYLGEWGDTLLYLKKKYRDYDTFRKEALFLKTLRHPGIPIVYDVEKVSGGKGRANDLSVEDRTRLTALFCQTVQDAGYKPMIYHNMEMATLMLDLGQLEQYDKWFAYYNDDLYYPYAYKVWQYTEKGAVDGINEEVDLNIWFGDF